MDRQLAGLTDPHHAIGGVEQGENSQSLPTHLSILKRGPHAQVKVRRVFMPHDIG